MVVCVLLKVEACVGIRSSIVTDWLESSRDEFYPACDPDRQRDRQTILFNIWKIRYQGEENDRKVFESSSPSKHSRTAQKKHKSSCSGDDQQSTNFI